MKTKKKYGSISCLLALTLALSLLAGCGTSGVGASVPPADATPEAAAATTPESPVADESLAADMVLTNGTIITMVSEGDTAEALAVKDGEIIYVGDAAGVEAFISDTTEVIDLAEKTVTPGFIDGHTHACDYILAELNTVYLNKLPADLDLYRETLRTFVEKHPDMEIINGSGMDLRVFPDSIPTNDWINEIVNDRPVLITDFGGHGTLLNDYALEYCHITKDTPNPDGGLLYKDENGELTGYCSDSNSLIRQYIPRQNYSTAQYEEAFQIYEKESNSYGITSVNIAGLTINDADPWIPIHNLEEDGLLTLRVNCATIEGYGASQEIAQTLKDRLDNGQQYNSEFLKVCMAKVMLDGVPEGKSAALLEPYAEGAEMDADYCGTTRAAQEDLTNLITFLDAAGYQVQLHTMGDASVNMALNAIESAVKTNGTIDARHVLAHVELIADQDIQRMADMKVVAAMQPLWWYSDPSFAQLEKQMLGDERFENTYRTKEMMKTGVIITGSIDYPITQDDRPLYGIETGVTRTSPYTEQQDEPQYQRSVNQAVSVYDMLKCYTVNGAYELRMDSLIGTIEVGKKADLVILGQNILTCEAKDISDTQVVCTISDGRIVYQA